MHTIITEWVWRLFQQRKDYRSQNAGNFSNQHVRVTNHKDLPAFIYFVAGILEELITRFDRYFSICVKSIEIWTNFEGGEFYNFKARWGGGLYRIL